MKLYDHFDFVKAHSYDLKDKKISALAFLLASSIRLISLSVPAAFAAYAVAFALNSWNFGLYLHTTLFAVFYMLNLFQLGKIMSLCSKNVNTFSSAYLAYSVCAITFSGILAVPVEVHPDAVRIFMYLSIQFWSFSGTLVLWLSLFAVADTSFFEHNIIYMNDIKDPIIAAELVPRFAQYDLLTDPKKSLLVLLFVFPFLNMIEYMILLGMTSKKPNRCGCKSHKDDTDVESNEEEEIIEPEETS